MQLDREKIIEAMSGEINNLIVIKDGANSLRLTAGQIAKAAHNHRQCDRVQPMPERVRERVYDMLQTMTALRPTCDSRRDGNLTTHRSMVDRLKSVARQPF